MKRMIVMAVSILLALTLAMPVAFGKAGQSEKASGSPVELAAAWWQWALSKPVEDFPLFGGDPTYTEEQCNGEPVTDTKTETWFLGGSVSGDPVVRTCSVPAGSQLFLPVVNTVWVFTDPETDTDKQARKEVQGFMTALLSDPEFSMVVTVDGEEVHRIVRGKSHFFEVQLPEDNVFGEPAGTYRALADGFWVTLPPLSEGEHTIHIEMSSTNFSQDITYRLTVV